MDAIIPTTKPNTGAMPVEIGEKPPQNAAAMAERQSRMMYSSRWASLTPRDYGAMLRNFELGYFPQCAPTMERVLAYDGIVGTVAPKRWRAVSGKDWEIATVDDSEEAKRQADYLDDFYKTLVASSATATDMRCGIETLVFQLVQAQAFKYAAAEIEWHTATTAKGEPTYHAKTIHCPLRFFEATTRELRIITSGSSVFRGDPLDPRGWIVACAPGEALALPTLLLFMLKMTPLEDWAATVETFAVPFIFGKTSAAYGSAEWRALEELVRNAKNRFGGVVGKDVEIIVQNGLSQAGSPHREMIEYLDRVLISLWRGGDLSTLSQAGDSAGSNPQSEEMDAIAEGDMQFVEGVLNTQIGEVFLKLVFGDAVRPLAYFKFVRNDEAKRSAELNTLRTAYDMGLELPENYVRAKFGIPAIAEGDKILKRQEPAGMPLGGDGIPFANEVSDALTKAATKLNLRESEREQYSRVEAFLARLEKAANEEEFNALIAEFKRRFPALAANVLSRDDVADALAESLRINA